jgi:TetR/AcrR family transcriptional regulator, transcriptional repressor of bet genes
MAEAGADPAAADGVRGAGRAGGTGTGGEVLSAAARARREALAGAALAVLRREGYAAVTARKVAAEAQMSLGHISYHFEDMGELMAQAYRLASADLQQAEARLDAAGGSVRDRLEALLRAGFTDEILDPGYLRVRIDLWSAALARPEVAATELELYRAYRARLEQLLTELAGPARSDRVPAVTDLLMATLDGLWLDWMRRRDRASVDRVLDLGLRLAERELSPRRPARAR